MELYKQLMAMWQRSSGETRRLQVLAWKVYEGGLSDTKPPFPKPDGGDLQGTTDAFIEMRNFAREVLELALARGESLGYMSDDDIVERWEVLTGEVYGVDYCDKRWAK